MKRKWGKMPLIEQQDVIVVSARRKGEMGASEAEAKIALIKELENYPPVRIISIAVTQKMAAGTQIGETTLIAVVESV